MPFFIFFHHTILSKLPYCAEINKNRLEIYYFLIKFLALLAYVHFLSYLCSGYYYGDKFVKYKRDENEWVVAIDSTFDGMQ